MKGSFRRTLPHPHPGPLPNPAKMCAEPLLEVQVLIRSAAANKLVKSAWAQHELLANRVTTFSL
eukprot:2346340-Amphidinium_carterae.1